MKRAASRVESGCPDEAQELWKALARDFAGDAIGEKAAAAEKENAADPAFRRELEALKAFRTIEKCAERLKPRRSDQAEENWRKRNLEVLQQLTALQRSFEKSHAETKVGARAREFLKGLGVG